MVYFAAVGPQCEGICHEFPTDDFKALGGFAEVRCHTLFRTHNIKELWIGRIPVRRAHDQRTLAYALQQVLADLPRLDLLVMNEAFARCPWQDGCPADPAADKPQFLYPRCLQVILQPQSTATSILEFLSAKLQPTNIIIAFLPYHREPRHDDTGLETRFLSVTYKHYEEVPQMPIPVQCSALGSSQRWDCSDSFRY